MGSPVPVVFNPTHTEYSPPWYVVNPNRPCGKWARRRRRGGSGDGIQILPSHPLHVSQQRDGDGRQTWFSAVASMITAFPGSVTTILTPCSANRAPTRDSANPVSEPARHLQLLSGKPQQCAPGAVTAPHALSARNACIAYPQQELEEGTACIPEPSQTCNVAGCQPSARLTTPVKPTRPNGTKSGFS